MTQIDARLSASESDVIDSQAVLRNLSEGGAFVETVAPTVVGSVVQLRFRLPGETQEIACTATVRHTRGGRGIGVEFRYLDPGDRYRIQQFVQSAFQLVAD